MFTTPRFVIAYRHCKSIKFFQLFHEPLIRVSRWVSWMSFQVQRSCNLQKTFSNRLATIHTEEKQKKNHEINKDLQQVLLEKQALVVVSPDRNVRPSLFRRRKKQVEDLDICKWRRGWLPFEEQDEHRLHQEDKTVDMVFHKEPSLAGIIVLKKKPYSKYKITQVA